MRRAGNAGMSCWRSHTVILKAAAGNHTGHVWYQLLAWAPQRAARYQLLPPTRSSLVFGVDRHAPLLEAATGTAHAQEGPL